MDPRHLYEAHVQVANEIGFVVKSGLRFLNSNVRSLLMSDPNRRALQRALTVGAFVGSPFRERCPSSALVDRSASLLVQPRQHLHRRGEEYGNSPCRWRASHHQVSGCSGARAIRISKTGRARAATTDR